MIIKSRYKIISGFKGRSFHHLLTIYLSPLISLGLIFIIIQLGHCSPPVDFFLHTATQSAPQEGSSPLPSLESIYHRGANENNDQNNNNNKYSKEIANRVLSLVQNVSHTHDNDQVDMETTRYAWHLMEEQTLNYMKKRISKIQPIIQALLNESNTSKDCQLAIKQWLLKLQDLDHWASLMWNSWGNLPPSGLFEGSFSDLGSYRGCLSIKDNDFIGKAQYCTLDFQPLIPSRPRFHSIYKKVLDWDEQTSLLTAGDFATEGPDRKINAKDSAHGYESTKHKLFWGKSVKPPKQSNKGGNFTLATSGTNSTLNTETLIELAKKAQYFYYVKFRIGACLPSKCSQSDVQKLAQTAGQRAILQASPVSCTTKEPIKLNGYQMTSIGILSTLVFIGIIGTIVDLLGYKDRKQYPFLHKWVMPFSIWTNSRRLFNSSGSNSALNSINGLRFFSTLWVIFGHTVLYTEYQLFTHAFKVIDTSVDSLMVLWALNGNFSVDTFFLVSGILTTYVTWDYMKGDAKKFNKFGFAISRYIRLTPQLAIVILCFFLLPLFGDGPLYKQITEEQATRCYDNWLINLLYLQCYVNPRTPCIDPSWWLSIEMTFHVISLFIILVLIKSTSKGMIFNFMVAAGLTLWGIIIHYSNGFAIGYIPSVPQKYEIVYEQTKMFFHKPYPHAASYFIGVALGHVLANRRIKKLTKPQLIFGWSFSTLGVIICLNGNYFWNLGAPYSQFTATAYYHMCQILWPTSLSWIVLVCYLGNGGFVQSILSAKVFVPLGRVTYMTYLSHALIIYYHTASSTIPIEPSLLLFSYIYLANTILSLSLGTVLTILYEVPMLNFQKIILQSFQPKPEVTLPSLTETNGLTNQLLIETDDLVETKILQKTCNNIKKENSINNITVDN